jgi:hypothetical protein
MASAGQRGCVRSCRMVTVFRPLRQRLAVRDSIGYRSVITRLRTVAIALVAALCSDLSAQQFSIAGLSRQTTVEEARVRYPGSSIFGQRIDVADADSHNHIYAIQLASADGSSRQLRLYFERHVHGRKVYPACDAVAATIRKQYGEPVNTQNFMEERSSNRRLIWSNASEELSLLCFRQGQQRFMAAELTIAGR